jgi:hypothetical protein
VPLQYYAGLRGEALMRRTPKDLEAVCDTPHGDEERRSASSFDVIAA